MNIFVGNLAPEVTEDQLAELFRQFGDVKSVEVARMLFTGESRGFGFVEMPGKKHSEAAIAGLNGRDLAGRPLNVNAAREKTPFRRNRRR